MKPTPTTIVVGLVKAYSAVISPLLPANCRYYPTCSAYAVDAVRKYGPVIGLKKAVLRILRCHPFHPGGYDPVL